MFLTKGLLQKIIYYKNTNIIIKGVNTELVDTLLIDSNVYTEYNTEYRCYKHIFCFNILKLTNKSDLLLLLKEICSCPDFFVGTTQKKIIILLNTDTINIQLFQKINSLIDKTYMSCLFIIHISTTKLLVPSISSRFLIINLPNKEIKDETIKITYKNIIKLIKQPYTIKSIEKTREICYMYYMNHYDSIYLQNILVRNIGSNNYIPNEIKFNLIKDLVDINKLYSYSFRKPIFLECFIYCLFKHLENYTYNL